MRDDKTEAYILFFSLSRPFTSSSAVIKLGDSTALLVPHQGQYLPKAKNKTFNHEMQSVREQTRLHPTEEQVKVFHPKLVSSAGESGCGVVWNTLM